MADQTETAGGRDELIEHAAAGEAQGSLLAKTALLRQRTAERDARQAGIENLQARIDKAIVECDREYPLGRVPLDEIPTAAQICDRIRAALQGDQPAEPPSPLSTPDTRSGEANGEASGEASGEARSGPAPQRIPAESRSTMDSGEDVAKHDPRPRRGNAIAEPNACGQCGIPQREHYTQVGSDGSHTHVQPTDAQRKARMRARREASAPFVPAADTFPKETHG